MQSPRIISAVVLIKDKKVMLVKEILEDKKEHWIFPGGGVEFGETIEDAARRETKEETNLDIRIKNFLGFKEIIRPQFDYHTIIFFFIAEPLNNEVKRIEKILDAKYFTINEAKSLSLVDSARWSLEEIINKSILN
jgi:8-oxo-dGTP diphosphatase